MSKMDKKIISIFLILIMTISSILPVFATDSNEYRKTLEQYLIEEGVDKNEDGKLSDEEWAKVKNLQLNNIQYDLSKIEKATNLERLTITADIEKEFLDLSKFKKLEILTISLYNFNERNDKKIDLILPELKQVKELRIFGDGHENVQNLDISKLSNLKVIYLTNMEEANIKFPNLENIEELYLNVANDIELDLSNNKKMSKLEIYRLNSVIGGLYPNLKVRENLIAKPHFIGYGYEISKKEDLIIEVGKRLNDYLPNSFKIECESTDILYKVDDLEIVAKSVGEQIIKITDSLQREHEIKVIVEEKETLDMTLEETGITADFINNAYGYGEAILKSNGELWEINSLKSGEKIETNVKNYTTVTTDVYRFDVKNILYNNNKLSIKLSYDNKNIKTSEISNVIDINNSSYLLENGDLYEINVNYITEEINFKKVMENVKDIVGKDYYVTESKETYTKSNDKYIKALDFAIIDAGSYNDENYSYRYTFVDENNTLLVPGENGVLRELVKNFEGYRRNTSGFMLTLEGDEAVITEWAYNAGTKILSDVDEINIINGIEVLLRKDGSIWTYDSDYGLYKIVKSTSPENKEDDVDIENKYIKNPDIKEKEIDKVLCISGLTVKQTVEDFINQNNFYSEYTVKVIDSENKELEGKKILSTGSKVQLYKDGNLEKEYVIIIYGDTTGDGKIEPLDALTLIKLVNNKIEEKNPVYLEAGKVTGKKTATAIDALTIVKSLNGKAEIKQDI